MQSLNEGDMLKFIVLGSSGSEYEIVALRNGENFQMSCTCEAGQHGTCCKHRLALLDGEISSLLSGNHADLLELKQLVCGTGVEKRYAMVCALEKEKALIDSKLKAEKKALGREMGAAR